MFKINKIEYLLKTNFHFVNKNFSTLFPSLFKKLLVYFLYTATYIISFSCNSWIQVNEDVVARIGTSYLYRDDLVGTNKTEISKSDSLLKTGKFIDNWALDHLLIKQAKIVLSEEELFKLDVMVDNYRTDLYANAYFKAVINKNLDTIVELKEINSFLFNNKEFFKLKSPLFQVRYIHLPPDNVDQNEIKISFQRFNQRDRIFLDSFSYQYNSYLLSDSIWLNKNNLLSKVEFLKQNNFNRYVKKLKFFNLQDTLGVYLFFVKEYLKEGELAPAEIITPKIKNIILNKRKQELIKQFEKDILQDAIKSKTFETY